ncbi:MAG: HesA/MoeB/ThiF family protein [Elusimicrobiales bacterium]|jgi:adenylyltransferase/sulfurtransferase|nr:HesA/MoeB/ThiF family protein [Elusimicrobiales bacterium]
MLTEREFLRYARQIVLPGAGAEGQEKLKRTSVCVVGAGGLGAPCIAYLAGAGVGRLVIIEPGRLEPGNLHRQIIYRNEDSGFSKARSAAAFAARLNPEVKADMRIEPLEEGNAEHIVSDCDIVADCTDNFAARALINRTCVRLRKPLVYAAIYRFEAQLAVFMPGRGCLACQFPSVEEGTIRPDEGVAGPAAGAAGAMQAMEALKLAWGMEPDGHMLLMDLRNNEFAKARLRRLPGCPVCGGGANGKISGT